MVKCRDAFCKALHDFRTNKKPLPNSLSYLLDDGEFFVFYRKYSAASQLASLLLFTNS